MYVRLLLVALLALPLLACKKPATVAENEPLPPAEPCPFVYVVAPGNYIVDIASGSEVVLDPAVSEFELFCSPGTARAAVNYAVASGALPEGDWRIYRLDGNLDDLAYRSPQNRYTLKRMAEVVDWVTEDI